MKWFIITIGLWILVIGFWGCGNNVEPSKPIPVDITKEYQSVFVGRWQAYVEKRPHGDPAEFIDSSWSFEIKAVKKIELGKDGAPDLWGLVFDSSQALGFIYKDGNRAFPNDYSSYPDRRTVYHFDNINSIGGGSSFDFSVEADSGYGGTVLWKDEAPYISKRFIAYRTK